MAGRCPICGDANGGCGAQPLEKPVLGEWGPPGVNVGPLPPAPPPAIVVQNALEPEPAKRVRVDVA